MTRRPRILLVGPLPLEGTPIGGTQVSFAELVRRVQASQRLEYEVVDTSRPVAGRSGWSRVPGDVRTLTATLRAVAKLGPACDAVVFNASSGGALKAGPFVWAAARAIRRPFALRVFGGDLDLHLARAPAWRRAAAERTCLSAPLVLLQTRQLCEHFARLSGVRWLPTTRDLEPQERARAAGCRSFLFLSQLRREKGLAEVLTASDTLPPGASLTLHGPTTPGTALEDGHARATFAGPARSDQVPAILARHDALVFPTWYEGEGMPGAIIEAMQSGLPVIASRWRSIPELVVDGENGLLVPPRDAAALAAAMQRLAGDTRLHARLAQGARATGERFRGAAWHVHLEGWIEALARDGGIAADHASKSAPKAA